MMTDREKELLCNSEYINDYILSNFTDEEIIDNINLFIYKLKFSETETYARIIINATPEMFKNLDKHGYGIPIPKTCFSRKDLENAIEKGMNVSKMDFTRSWMHLCNTADNINKYKKYIDFDLLVREDKYISDELIEACYEELSKVSTRALLQRMEQSAGTKFENSYEKARLLDKLENISNRKFSNDAFIMRLLKGFMDVPYTNPDYYKEIFEYIDDQYIIDHFLLFNPLQLVYAERFNEEIYKKVINNETMFSRYGYELQRLVTDLSVDFLVNNYKSMNPYLLSFQKNIIELHKLHPLVDIHPETIYFHNKYLTNEELDYVRNLIKDTPMEKIMRCMKIDDYTPPLALERLMNLKGVNNE